MTPEAERVKDVWDMAVFGHNGHISFAPVLQEPLREAMKIWVYDDLPRRRNKNAVQHTRAIIAAVGMLSASLRMQREDRGTVPAAWGRSDIVAFTNGAVPGPSRVIRHLVETARTFIFDTGLAPARVGAALGALRLLREEPERAARARAVARRLSAGLAATGLEASLAGRGRGVGTRALSPEAAVAWARACREAGVAVGGFRPPSVPDRFLLRVPVRR